MKSTQHVVALISVVFLLLTLPLPQVPLNDKILHIGLFFCLTILIPRAPLVLLLAVSLELIQLYIPSREFSQGDLLANLVGTVGALVILRSISDPWWSLVKTQRGSFDRAKGRVSLSFLKNFARSASNTYDQGKKNN